MFKRRRDLQKLLDTTRKNLLEVEDAIGERNKLIKCQLEQIIELKKKIVDLEYNVEFLVDNLSPQKKKLARTENQN